MVSHNHRLLPPLFYNTLVNLWVPGFVKRQGLQNLGLVLLFVTSFFDSLFLGGFCGLRLRKPLTLGLLRLRPQKPPKKSESKKDATHVTIYNSIYFLNIFIINNVQNRVIYVISNSKECHHVNYSVLNIY